MRFLGFKKLGYSTVFRNGVDIGAKPLKSKLLLLVLLLMMTSMVFAQTDENSQSKDPKYIIDPETGRLSMVIRVWGEVKQPGVTMVPSDADLISLLSYVGGPTDRAKLNNIRIIRYLEHEGEERIVYANIEAFLETGDDKYIPEIYPNDTIIVNGTIWKVLTGFSPFISLAVTILQAYYYFQIASGR